jgi:hypothetical protein
MQVLGDPKGAIQVDLNDRILKGFGSAPKMKIRMCIYIYRTHKLLTHMDSHGPTVSYS